MSVGALGLKKCYHAHKIKVVLNGQVTEHVFSVHFWPKRVSIMKETLPSNPKLNFENQINRTEVMAKKLKLSVLENDISLQKNP